MTKLVETEIGEMISLGCARTVRDLQVCAESFERDHMRTTAALLRKAAAEIVRLDARLRRKRTGG